METTNDVIQLDNLPTYIKHSELYRTLVKNNVKTIASIINNTCLAQVAIATPIIEKKLSLIEKKYTNVNKNISTTFKIPVYRNDDNFNCNNNDMVNFEILIKTIYFWKVDLDKIPIEFYTYDYCNFFKKFKNPIADFFAKNGLISYRMISYGIKCNNINYINYIIDNNSITTETLFLISCTYGNINTAQYVLKKWIGNEQKIVHIDPYINKEVIFANACQNSLEMAQWFLSIANQYYNEKINIHINMEYIFTELCNEGKLNVAMWLASIAEEYSGKKIDIHINNELIFRRICLRGQLKVAQWLFNFSVGYSGVSINIHENYEEAFNDACCNGKLNVVKWLIDVSLENLGKTIDIYNSNPFLGKTNDGNFKGAVVKTTQICRKIDIHIDMFNIFNTICLNGYLELAKYLVSISEEYSGKKIDIHCENELPFLKSYSNIKITKWLLEISEEYSGKKINIHARNNEVLNFACTHGNLELVKYLLEISVAYSGVNFNLHSEDEKIIVNACISGNIELIKFLLSLNDGSKPDEQINIHANNERAFITACEHGNFNTVKFLTGPFITKKYGKIDIFAERLASFKHAKNNNYLEILLWLKTISKLHYGRTIEDYEL